MKYLIVGGLGFIGSNFADYLLNNGQEVVIVDNLESGKIEFLEQHKSNPNLNIIIHDIRDWGVIKVELIKFNIDCIIHLASNANIAEAITYPGIDFENGTLITHHVSELARILKIKKVVYASGSGVYGDRGMNLLAENGVELDPISPYGASKLAGEALLRSYAYMFDIEVIIFRFANVVGNNQTHGVGLDFLKSLKNNKASLKILGDGNQSKQYIHVSDLIAAIMHVIKVSNENLILNIGTTNRITVTEIAEMCLDLLRIDKSNFQFEYSGGARGWSGDVPLVNLSIDKILKLGWRPKYNSREAMQMALKSTWDQLKDL